MKKKNSLLRQLTQDNVIGFFCHLSFRVISLIFIYPEIKCTPGGSDNFCPCRSVCAGHLRRCVWNRAYSELHLPAARACWLEEAVTVLPSGLWQRFEAWEAAGCRHSHFTQPESRQKAAGCSRLPQSPMAVQVTVLPSPRCLFDDPVQIRVTGLLPQQAVTLRACLLDEAGELFQAHARYRAGGSGELDLTRCPALGGSYSGVEPMGLLWSLQSKTPYKRLAKRNVLTPFCVDLEVYEGHGDMSQLLGKCTHERYFLGEGVKRISVREGRLKATLFLPPGEF